MLSVPYHCTYCSSWPLVPCHVSFVHNFELSFNTDVLSDMSRTSFLHQSGLVCVTVWFRFPLCHTLGARFNTLSLKLCKSAILLNCVTSTVHKCNDKSKAYQWLITIHVNCASVFRNFHLSFCISALVQVPTLASNSLKLFVEYQTNPVLSTVTQTHEICCFGNELNLV